MRAILWLLLIGACGKHADAPSTQSTGSASQSRDASGAAPCAAVLNERDLTDLSLSPGSKEIRLRSEPAGDSITVLISLGGAAVYKPALQTDQRRIAGSAGETQTPPPTLVENWAPPAEADGSHEVTSYFDTRVQLEVSAYKGDHVLSLTLRGPAPLSPERLQLAHDIGRRVLTTGLSPAAGGAGLACSTMLSDADATTLGLSRTATTTTYGDHATHDSFDVSVLAGGTPVYDGLLAEAGTSHRAWASATEADDSFDTASAPLAGSSALDVVARKGDTIVKVSLTAITALTAERAERAHDIARRVLARL